MTDAHSPMRMFLSYSWDSPGHIEWVTRLARALDSECDIHIVFDQFDLWAGRDLLNFMERGLESDRIVVISTTDYVRKARERLGGVGYECSIITAELAESVLADKFVPVLREGDQVPSFLKSKLRVDLRDTVDFDVGVQRLLAAARREPLAKRPPKRAPMLPAPLPAPSPYVHQVPPPRPLRPAEVQFGVMWSGSAGHISDFSLTAANSGDFVAHDVSVRVEFREAPHFEISLGDLDPESKKEINLLEQAAKLGVEGAHRILMHVNQVASGQVSPDPGNRFLLLYTDSEGRERASAILIDHDPKRRMLNLRHAPVSKRDPI